VVVEIIVDAVFDVVVDMLEPSALEGINAHVPVTIQLARSARFRSLKY
jgi:hypothetical protein